jgi:predicted ATPase/transcriptional regulator with XRE-family HTH domain
MEETRFGDLLRRLRLAADLSQEELAERAGLSTQAISALERGVRRAPYRHTLDALATALGLSAPDRTSLLAAAQRRRGNRSEDAAGPQVAVAPLPAVAITVAPAASPAPGKPGAGLIGREVAFAEVVALVRHAGARLLTITGPGGVGKTRLALAVAATLGSAFTGGTAIVPLADLREPSQVPGQIGLALGLTGRAPDPAAALREHLRDRQVLLVLDNFEQLLPAAPFVADLLAACPQLCILITSRAPLRLARERVYDLPPLAFPDPGSTVAPATLGDYGAPALFTARARAVRPDFTLTEANATTVAAICARLDGLPLAIELAAARLGLLAPAELLERLAARLPLLTSGPRDLPERQRTLRAAIAWSHDLLNSGEQALFRRLAVFSGGATLAAIESVCAPPAPLSVELLDWLGGLVEQGLVRREFADADAPPRFSMLETVREYAAEQLAAHGEAVSHQRRHAAHFLRFAEEASAHQTGAQQAQWHARVAAEHDNFRAALRWALDSGDTDIAIRLGAALWRFWYITERWTEGRGWLRAILALPATEVAPEDGAPLLQERAQAERGAGMLAVIQADFAPAHDHLQAALALARRSGNETLAVRVLDNLAILAKERGDNRAAIVLHEEALAAQRALGVERDIAVTLTNLGLAYSGVSDFRRAAACLDEALSLSRAVGDHYSVLIALVNLGGQLHYLGEYARSRALSEEGLALARRQDNRFIAAMALLNLGAVASDRAEAAAAVAAFSEALELVRPLDSGMRLGRTYASLGNALRRHGDRDGAAAAIAEALAVASAIGDEWSMVLAHLYRGALAEDSGDCARAGDDYRAALNLARAIHYDGGIASSLNRLGMLTPDPVEAAAYFRESLGRCAAMGHPLLGVEALEGLAAATLKLGDAEGAGRLLGAAGALRERLGTPREATWAAHCARTTEDTRAALGDGEFAAVTAAGRLLDFDAALVAAETMAATVGR